MNKAVSDLLGCLIQTVNLYDEQIGINQTNQQIMRSPEFEEKQRDVKKLYECLTSEDREEFFSILDQEFNDEVTLHIYLFSLMQKVVHSREIFENLIRIICQGKLDVYSNIGLELQLVVEANKNYEQGELYELQRRLHSYNLESFRRLIKPPEDYVPYHKRNKNRIVIMMEQALAEQHAPSKITYDLCYTLQKHLGLEVLLITSPISAADLKSKNCWMEEIYTDIYYPELNGNYIFIFTHDKTYNMPCELNDYFILQYQDCNIRGRQVPVLSENTDKFKQLINIIYDFNPAFIYNVDAISPIAEICSGFTTVVSGAMNYGYPVSDAQILMKLIEKDEAEPDGPDIALFKPYNQLVINDRLQFSVEPPLNPETRSKYGISEEAFLLIVIGNRLQFDLTEEFKRILKSIFQIDIKLELLLIGNYSEYQVYFADEIFRGRIHYIGYHRHLSEVLGIADLFLNPPRTGGGTSALISLYCGVPVVTLPEGDVAGNVGADFICRDEKDLIDTIKRYLTDPGFYEHQKQTGLDNMRKLTDPVGNLKNKIDKITKAISILEGGINEDQL